MLRRDRTGLRFLCDGGAREKQRARGSADEDAFHNDFLRNLEWWVAPK
jgi:hypothetical protein